jgi:glycolate dehydrogenase FAD-binding subunit
VSTQNDSPQTALRTQSQRFSASLASSASSAYAAVEVIEPDTAEEVAAALKRASDARQSIVIRGAGTKLDQGRPAQRIDAFLSTRRLNRVLEHQHGDLTATIEGGATLRDVNDTLARYGQCLPLDPPFADHATIGGILATNDSGPLRHRFGTPRDLVIGVQLATTDGALAKAGGQVVKNVAGYDLSKLVCGSCGSLAAIVRATFKLTPLPAASKTITIEAPDLEPLGRILREVMSSQIEPIAFEVHVQPQSVMIVGRPFQGRQDAGPDLSAVASAGAERPGLRIILRFASLPAVVDAQIAQTQALQSIKECATTVLDDRSERELWDTHARSFWDAPGAIVRAGWLPTNLAAALKECGASITELAGRAAVGGGLIRIDGDASRQAAAVAQLRRSTSFHNLVVLRADDELKSMVDVWDLKPDRARLFASLKQALDPNNTLNAGRGPL